MGEQSCSCRSGWTWWENPHLPLTCSVPSWGTGMDSSHPHLWELHSTLWMLPSYLWLNLPLSPLLCVLALPQGCISCIPLTPGPSTLVAGLSPGVSELSTRQDQHIPGRNFPSLRQTAPCSAKAERSHPCTPGVFPGKGAQQDFPPGALHGATGAAAGEEESVKLFTALWESLTLFSLSP